MKNNRIWFLGVWLLPLGFLGSFCLGLLIRALMGLKYIGSGYVPPLDPLTIFKLILLSFVPTLICIVVNLFRYLFLGVRDFRPFIKNNPLSVSKDKQYAMSAFLNKEYLSRVPDGFTVGKWKNRFFRIPVKPHNILHTLVIGGSGTGKSSTVLNSLIYNFQVAPPEKKMTVTGRLQVFPQMVFPSISS